MEQRDIETLRELSFRESLVSAKELNECDKLDLHLLGSIQGDSGNVFFVSYPEGRIVAADDKIIDVPFVEGSSGSCEKILGALVQDVMPRNIVKRIFETIEQMKRSFTMRSFDFLSEGGKFFALSFATTKTDHSLISIEIEEFDNEEATASFQSSLDYLASIMNFEASEKAATQACDTLFDFLPCYDRGMVYRFNDDLSGEVIHEAKRDHITTLYLGHRFPASDIPMTSRMLYIKNILRYIKDSNAEDVPIRSLEGDVDLTQVRSRACHKAHLIYMRNMGVTCSLSLAIVVDNELWGLLAFHGYAKPFKPTLHQRIACETVSSMVSARVESLVKKRQSARIVRLGEVLMRWKQGTRVKDNLDRMGKVILDIVEADVMVGMIEDATSQDIGRIVTGDETLSPGEEFWKKMIHYPNREMCVRSTRDSIRKLGLTEADCPAPGFVYFREGQTQFFIGRGWRSRDVLWGGNPDEAKLRIGGVLNPRKSFESFLQKAKTESRVWNPADQCVVQLLRDRICLEQSHNWMMALMKNDIEEANVRYLNSIQRSEENSDFFAHMCHELRTPFHGVMGCLNILNDSLDQMDKEEMKDLVQTSISSGNHMIHLLNDILNRSKNKYLATSSFRDRVNYQKLASEAVECMRSLAINMHLTFNVEISPEESVGIVADRTKITQVVTNILNNAIKFAGADALVETKFNLVDTMKDAVTEWERDAETYAATAFTRREGEMLDSIEAVKQATASESNDKPAEKWMFISVRDTGVGIDVHELAKMFEPYTQSTIQRTSVYQGTGLGLYICVALCHQLRGFIACSSTLGRGTVFHVGVPIEIMRKSDKQEAEGEEPNEDAMSTISIGGPLVIVDDNLVNVKLLERQLMLELKKVGIDLELITAYGGQEAIDVYKERLPSVLVIDYHMPDVDGVEATQAIRKYELEHEIEPAFILSYTADTTEKAEKLLLSSGANEIMSKPPPKSFVANLVRRFRITTTTDVIRNGGRNFD